MKSVDKSKQPKDRGEFPVKQDSNTLRQSKNQEEKTLTKSRELKNEETQKPYRGGVTVRMKLAPERNWRGLDKGNVHQLARLSG